MKQKTVFFDIDGTLLGTKNGRMFQIPPSTLCALKKLRENGHRIAICSGRQEAFIHKFFPGLFQSYVASNGAHVVFEGTNIVNRIFSPDRIRHLISHFSSFGCSFVFVGNHHGWTWNIPQHMMRHLEKMYGLPNFLVDDWQPEQVKAGLIDFVFETEEDYNRCAGAFTGGMVINHHPGGLTADLSLPDCNKAKGIETFLAYSGIPKEDTIAFGDGYNDVSMMDAVGCGVAMGNAVAPVKEKADYITASVFEDGIEKGLKYLGLI
jgi:Cof subfamily protein (haloacid dehalogenase superfamily)